MRPQLMRSSQSQGFFTNITILVIGNWDFFQLLVTFSGVRNPDNQGLAVAEIFTGKFLKFELCRLQSRPIFWSLKDKESPFGLNPISS